MLQPLHQADTISPDVERRLALAFAPLDKRALGLAFGTALALLIALVTAVSLVADPTHRFPLELLAQYFAGYSVSAVGIVVGALWGFATGFFWGWFIAFARNFVLAVWLMTIRIRADFATQRDFLDHI